MYGVVAVIVAVAFAVAGAIVFEYVSGVAVVGVVCMTFLRGWLSVWRFVDCVFRASLAPLSWFAVGAWCWVVRVVFFCCVGVLFDMSSV